MVQSKFQLHSATLPSAAPPAETATANRFVNGAEARSTELLVKFTVPLDSARHDKMRVHAALARRSMAEFLRDLIDRLPAVELPPR
ncbi:MAG: hypothetical protein JWR07_4034 [Nevskia sp.]|nr:hypothetical protein [Nevskia sp.]